MTNLITTENIKSLAELVNGKIWEKGDKRRIYVTGGNNYHYNGKWYFEIYEDGTFEAKCYLESGYNNKNREQYVKDHLSEMERDMKEAFEELSETTETAVEVVETPVAEPVILQNQTDNYHGCGSYIVAIENNTIINAVNFSSNMLETDRPAFVDMKKNNPDATVIYLDGSGTMFFARKKEHVSMFQTKCYYVPKAGGGKHFNIELKK